MVFSLTPRQSPSASLSLSPSSLTPSPSLSLSATRCFSLLSSSSFFFFCCFCCVPGLERESEGERACVCVRSVCVWARGLRAHWVGVKSLPQCWLSVFSLPAPSRTHTHIHTYTMGRQWRGWRGRDERVCQSLSSQLEQRISPAVHPPLPHPPILPAWPTLTFCLSLWVMSLPPTTHSLSPPLSPCFTVIYPHLSLAHSPPPPPPPHTHTHLPSGNYLTDGMNWKQQHFCRAQGQWSAIDLACYIHKAIICCMSRCRRVWPHMCVWACLLFKGCDQASIRAEMGRTHTRSSSHTAAYRSKIITHTLRGSWRWREIRFKSFVTAAKVCSRSWYSWSKINFITVQLTKQSHHHVHPVAVLIKTQWSWHDMVFLTFMLNNIQCSSWKLTSDPLCINYLYISLQLFVIIQLTVLLLLVIID